MPILTDLLKGLLGPIFEMWNGLFRSFSSMQFDVFGLPFFGWVLLFFGLGLFFQAIDN